MNQPMPEIVSVGFYNARLVHKGEQTSNRKTSMFELELVAGDGGTSYIDSESAKIEDGLIIAAKPGQKRHTRLPFQCYYVHLIVGEGLLCETLLSLPSFIHVEDPAPYREMFLRMLHAYETAQQTDLLLLQSELLRLIHTLASETQKQTYSPKAHNGATIEGIIQYIDQHLTEELSLAKLAALASFSPVHFHNCFKRSTGKTLRAYIEDQRIRRAAALLVSTDHTLAEIAQDCGFSSQSYFSFVFKRAMGETPREYALRIHREYEKQ